MSAEEHKRLAMRFYDEVMNAGDMSLIDELIHDDFVDHEEVPGIPSTKAGVPMWIEMMRTAFPDMKTSVLGMMADDDEVWIHSRVTGTHRGEFMGMAPTDEKVDVQAIDRVRVKDRKAIEHWGITDMMMLMQQIGTLPPPQ